MNETLQLDSTTAPGSSSCSAQKQWYAVYTAYRQEPRVAACLQNHAIEHYLPVYGAQRRWTELSRSARELPLFPCYVFVCITPEQRIPVLETPGVLWMVGDSGSQPIALPSLEIETLRATLDPSRVEPHPYLASGQRVRIRAGMLAGLEGFATGRKGNLRVVISLELIMQSIAIEVAANDLEFIDHPAIAGTSALQGARELAFCLL